MSDKKKLNVGRELTDDELMEMTGGASFRIACQKRYSFKPSLPTVKYGIITDPEVTLKYGINPEHKPLYGIDPIAYPLYGIKPIE